MPVSTTAAITVSLPPGLMSQARGMSIAVEVPLPFGEPRIVGRGARVIEVVRAPRTPPRAGRATAPPESWRRVRFDAVSTPTSPTRSANRLGAGRLRSDSSARCCPVVAHARAESHQDFAGDVVEFAIFERGNNRKGAGRASEASGAAESSSQLRADRCAR